MSSVREPGTGRDPGVHVATTAFTLEPGARPRGDVIFTSIDSVGTPGGLNQYVLEALGLSASSLPSRDQLSRGYHVATIGQERVLCFVVTVGDGDTAELLHENLAAALSSLGSRITNKTLWLPLMGTGAGGLSYRHSLRAMLAAVRESTPLPPAAAIVIAPPPSFSAADIDSLREELERVAPGLVRYSASVAGLVGSMPSTVTAAEIVRRLLDDHPEYVHDLPGDLGLPTEGGRQRLDAWLTNVAALFRGLDVLHGRLVIVGLALLDDDLGRSLWRSQALTQVASAIREPLEGLLTEDGWRRWQALGHEPDSVPTLTDQPAGVDWLSRKAFCDSLALRLRSNRHDETTNRTNGPFMLHLYGAWGSGKSTIFNLLTATLERGDPSDPWVVVNFNAWQHERLGTPWWWLIEAVYRQGRHKIAPWRRAWVWSSEALWHWWHLYGGPYHAVLGLALMAVAFGLEWKGAWLLGQVRAVVGSGEAVDSFKRVGEVLKAVSAAGGLVTFVWPLLRPLFAAAPSAPSVLLTSRHDPQRLLIDRFNMMIARYGRPVAVLIDDLDRCRGDYVVALLEGIQTLLKTSPVTYVVAADRRWLKASFEKAYEGYVTSVGEPGRPLGYLFLEKLFEVSVALPRLTPEIQAAYWARLLRTHEAITGPDLGSLRQHARADLERLGSEEEILAMVERPRADVVYDRVLREEAVQRLAAPSLEQRTRHFLHQFAPLVEPNPRAMKRLVNAYGIVRSVALLAGADIDRVQLARWIILNLRWPALGDFLESCPEAIGGGDAVPLDPPMRALLLSRAVTDVIRGGGVGRPLDQRAVDRCAALS